MSKPPKKTSKKTSQKSPAPLILVMEADDISDSPDYAELLTVPRLGGVRAQALAEIGIKTLADLHSASHEQIGSVKGVGLRNAELIKQWLATQAFSTPPETNLPSDGFISMTAQTNQAIQDDLTEMDMVILQIKETLPKKSRDKKLLGQLEKLTDVASELPESMDTLTASQAQAAIQALEKIVITLQAAGEAGPLNGKAQAALRDALRTRRKQLQKAIGD